MMKRNNSVLSQMARKTFMSEEFHLKNTNRCLLRASTSSPLNLNSLKFKSTSLDESKNLSNENTPFITKSNITPMKKANKSSKNKKLNIEMTYYTNSMSNLLHEKYSVKDISDFLIEHMEEYGDGSESITKCVEFALSNEKGKGGGVMIATNTENDEILGVVVMNNTNKTVYHPELLLGYIAVSSKSRGNGLGKKLLNQIFQTVEGDICLHVESENKTAKKLYEKMGFENKYLEMRYIRSNHKNNEKQ